MVELKFFEEIKYFLMTGEYYAPVNNHMILAERKCNSCGFWKTICLTL
jgi:hypothetical protein